MERLRDHPERTERLTALLRPLDLPTFAEAEAEVAAAERAEGWLARCDDDARYLRITREFAGALGRVLRSLGPGPILEICAGDGTLARVLRAQGLAVSATDLAPVSGRDTPPLPYSAAESLDRFPAASVLGSFVPFDAGIHDRVLSAEHVRHYLILDAWPEGVGRPGTPGQGWRAQPLPQVSRWMITRHDAWLGDGIPVARRGEAWLLSREPREAVR